MRGSKYTLLRSFVFMALTAGLICCISSCNPMPNNGVPIYLQIDSPKVVSTPYFGSASSSIPGVWATTGGHNLGAYELPVNIPVLAGGSVPIALSAGIYDNGIVNAPAIYPFYIPDTFTIQNAIPGHIYHHKPVYGYYAYATMGIIGGDFESNNPFTNMTLLTRSSPTDSNVYEGAGSGGIVLASNVDSVTAIQTTGVVINTSGRQAYVEFNYRLNNPYVLCDVGVIATLYSGTQATQTVTFDKIILTGPNGYWNKVYLNFNSEIGGNPNYTFQVYFTGYHTPGQQDTVFLDNIKLLYFHD